MYTSRNRSNSRYNGHPNGKSSDLSARHERVSAASRCLDQHLQELADQMSQGKSDRLLAYLGFCSRFHHYSICNQILIWSQCSHATRVAGIRTWNELGRRVRQGQHGILIFAPIRYRKESGHHTNEHEDEIDRVREEVEVTTFRAVYVFDLSQTEGPPVPTLLDAQGDASLALPAIRMLIRQRGIDLIEDGGDDGTTLPPGADGVSCGGRIIVRSDLADPERFRTLAHELTHELLHHNGSPRPDHRIRETEADAAAFVVCRHFGIECDTSDYLLLHDSDTEILLSRLERIRQTAGEVIDGIESFIESTGEFHSKVGSARLREASVERVYTPVPA